MAAKNPTVSVIIPCFNHGEFIDEAVDSVLRQTIQNFEIIIVNDGSTDHKTRETLKNYQRNKTTIFHTENRGPAAARNFGIAKSQGEFILPLDADDKIGEDYLETGVEILKSHPKLGIVYCEAEFFGKEKRGKWNLPEYSYPEILYENQIFCSGLFRRVDWEKVGGYDEEMVFGLEDYDFWLSLIETGKGVFRIPKTMFFYRYQSHSRNNKLEMENLWKSYSKIFHNHAELYKENSEQIFRKMVELRQEVIRLRHSRIFALSRFLGKIPLLKNFLEAL